MKKRENKVTNSFKNLSMDCDCRGHCFCTGGKAHYTDLYDFTGPITESAWNNVRPQSL